MIVTKKVQNKDYKEFDGVNEIFLFNDKEDRQSKLKCLKLDLFEDLKSLNYITNHLVPEGFEKYYNDKLYKKNSFYGYSEKEALKLVNKFESVIDVNASFERFHLVNFSGNKFLFSLNYWSETDEKTVKLERKNFKDKYGNYTEILSYIETPEKPIYRELKEINGSSFLDSINKTKNIWAQKRREFYVKTGFDSF